MKTELFDFQQDALEKLRLKLNQARLGASPDTPQAIAFSAPTGAGKTIVMTALFEQILFGEHDLAAQPDAAILWISDMPELNEQTRLKVEAMSSRIRSNQLVTIDTGFDTERLAGGCIYFVNTQKLGTDKLLTRGSDIRQFPIWETFTNTAREAPKRFYVVIDEAHRGMNRGAKAQTAQSIMQRFILGSDKDGLCRMPMVLGISATPKRFEQMLEGTDHTVHKVPVPPKDVRASGLLKDRILIHYPEAESQAQMALLAQAAREWQAMDGAWNAYCATQKESRVYPILVVQVEDGTESNLTRTDLSAAISTIEDAIGRKLNEGEIAHTFNDEGDLAINGHKLRREDASRIQETKSIGVVFFKMSLSTGWDCPRAEIMMSFRPAQDHTYIAQLLGRMVRSPLARRIESQAGLNDVHLYLPRYDREAVDAVIEDLKNHDDVPPADAGTPAELVTLQRQPGTEDIFAAVGDLVTYQVDAVRKQPALRRYIKLARTLTHDGIADDVLQEAQEAIVEWLDAEIKRLKASTDFDAQVKRLTGVNLKTVQFAYGSGAAEESDAWAVEAAQADIDRQFETAGRLLGEGLHQTWWKANADADNPGETKIDLLVLAADRPALDVIQEQAAAAFDTLYANHQRAIRKRPEKLRARYRRLRAAATEPEALSWELPETLGFKRSKKAPMYDRHLYVEDGGVFRADLAGWESGVINEELANPSVIGWLRNVERKPWALQIPYRVAGSVKPMYPDFLVVRESEDGYLFDILEPHDSTRDDNHSKAVGLAEFTDRHEDLFDRVQLIREAQGSDGQRYFARLDMGDVPTRKAVRAVESNAQLNTVFEEFAR